MLANGKKRKTVWERMARRSPENGRWKEKSSRLGVWGAVGADF